MTIALSYLNDLSRVRIVLSSITPDGAVKVERALVTAGPAWETVRGGTALPILSGSGQLDDYEFGDSVLNHYRVTRAFPVPGLQLPGDSGDYASTPDSAALDITGDIELRVLAAADDWLEAGDHFFAAKGSGTDISYRFGVNAGFPFAHLSIDGTSFFTTTSSVQVPADAGEQIALRIVVDVDDGADRVVWFYYGPTIDGPWTLLDQVTADTQITIHVGTAALEIGSRGAGTAGLFSGSIAAVKLIDDPFGTPAEVANPDFAAEADSTASFSDDAGNTWTMNGNSFILTGEPLENDSITPDLNGITWLKSLKYPALNRPIGEFPDFRPPQRSSRTGAYNIKGRVPPIAIHDAWTSQWWTIEFVTETLAQARDIDLCITAGGTYFIHVPVETENECFTNPVSGMPGGYVYILNSTWHPAVHGSSVRSWVLPVRVVATPAPEIAGTTLNWDTVKRLYGSWTALWASNPTWRDVWDQIMDPEDAVVL